MSVCLGPTIFNPSYEHAHPSKVAACVLDVWVMQPKRPEGAKDNVKRPCGPLARSQARRDPSLLVVNKGMVC